MFGKNLDKNVLKNLHAENFNEVERKIIFIFDEIRSTFFFHQPINGVNSKINI